MTIFGETGQGAGITDGGRALAFFTDRHAIIRRFSECLNEDPPPKQILFYCGPGGNGKSLLLRYLRMNCCKRLREWGDWLKDATHDDFLRHMSRAEDAEPVPTAFIDFANQYQSPSDPFAVLAKLRGDLVEFGLRFPLYEFACMWYLREAKQLKEAQLKTLFMSEELTAVSELLTAAAHSVPGLSLVAAMLPLLHKRATGRALDEWFSTYLKKRKLTDEQVRLVTLMDPNSELLDKLPELFAQDLNTVVTMNGRCPRVVLFFDGHQAFWTQGHDHLNDPYFASDRWFRRLLGSLEVPFSTVVVVSGREPPHWHQASEWKIPSNYVAAQPVEDFTDPDARDYLGHALRDVAPDVNLHERLCEVARVAADRVHPLYLGLCADIVWASADKGTQLTAADFASLPAVADRGKVLIARLMSNVDAEIKAAVEALSACRTFDDAVFRALGEELRFLCTDAQFNVLVQFSFVTGQGQEDTARYRIHDLLRRLLREQGNETMHRADDALERYYRARAETGDAVALAEAIYHANRLDWRRGVSEWVDALDAALRQSRYDVCRALLGVLPELAIESDVARADVFRAEGEYYARLALARLGALQATLAQPEAALQSYQKAIAAYDRALQWAPDNLEAHINKCNALRSLGNLQAALWQHEAALQSYHDAIAAYAQARDLAPDDVGVYNNKGLALQSLGDLQAAFAQHETARGIYVEAIAAFDQALRLAPGDEAARRARTATIAKLATLE